MFSQKVLTTCRTVPKVPRMHISARRLATVTEPPASTSSASPPSASLKPTTPQTTPGGKPVIRSGIVLNRHPILTRTPTPLESAYYAYQSRVQRALYNPFPSEFYFKPGSLLQGKFEQEEIGREREAFGRMPWLDSSSTQKASPASDILNQEDAVTPMPRESEADRTGDVRSLDRKGERNLYLLVTSKASGPEVWRFPQTDLIGNELLHEAVRRDLRSPYGAAMDTWVVSRVPMGVYHVTHPGDNYTFFYKAHIMQGQVHPDGERVADFAWLTKEEIKSRVDKHYWTGIKDMLSDF